MEDLLQVGAIASTHGVRGEVKVFPTTDDVKRYSKLKEVYLGEEDKAELLHIESVKYFKNMVIVKFKEYNSLNEVETIKGKKLFVTRTNAVKLKKDEYFIADLIVYVGSFSFPFNDAVAKRAYGLGLCFQTLGYDVAFIGDNVGINYGEISQEYIHNGFKYCNIHKCQSVFHDDVISLFDDRRIS